MKDERPKHHAVRANKYGQAGLKPGHSDTCNKDMAPQEMKKTTTDLKREVKGRGQGKAKEKGR